MWQEPKILELGSGTILINGTNPKTGTSDICYPVLLDSKLSLKLLQGLFDLLGGEKELGNLVGVQIEYIFFAIVGGDGTIVYYRVYDGMQKPLQHAF